MRLLRELRGALLPGLMTAWARPRNTLLTAAGFLIAAYMLLALLTIPAGLQQLSGHTGLPDVAVVMSGSQATEATGAMNMAEQTTLLGNLPGVAHDDQGHALVAPQFSVIVKLRRPDGTLGDLVVRGVSPEFWKVVGDVVHLHRGRLFKPGVRELIVGAAAAHGFVALDRNAHVLIRKLPWQVTGQFTANGSLWESELWTDIGALQPAWNAPGRVSSIWVKLASPAAFTSFDAALMGNASLKGLHAQRQTDYYGWQIGFILRYATIAAWGISIVLGLGAALAIANALNMALAARRRDTAVLRALGFRRGALAISMLIEVIVLGVTCACIAIVLSLLLLNGRNVGSATFFQSISFSLDVSPKVALFTILYTVGLGIIAAALPIAHAVRAPLTKALQDE